MYERGLAAGMKPSVAQQEVPLVGVREMLDKHLAHLADVLEKARELRAVVRHAVYDAPHEGEPRAAVGGDPQPGLAGRMQEADRLTNDIQVLIADARQAVTG